MFCSRVLQHGQRVWLKLSQTELKHSDIWSTHYSFVPLMSYILLVYTLSEGVLCWYTGSKGTSNHIKKKRKRKKMRIKLGCRNFLTVYTFCPRNYKRRNWMNKEGIYWFLASKACLRICNFWINLCLHSLLSYEKVEAPLKLNVRKEIIFNGEGK